MPDPNAESIQLLADALRRIIPPEAAKTPEGLDAATAAAFLGISRSKFHDLVARGMAPQPAELGVGKCPRWSRTELRAWLVSGAPSRAAWRDLRDAAIRRIG